MANVEPAAVNVAEPPADAAAEQLQLAPFVLFVPRNTLETTRESRNNAEQDESSTRRQ